MSQKINKRKRIKSNVPMLVGFTGKLLTIDWMEPKQTNVVHLNQQSITIGGEKHVIAQAGKRENTVHLIFEDRAISLPELMSAYEESSIRLNGETILFRDMTLGIMNELIGKTLACTCIQKSNKTYPESRIKPTIYQFEVAS